jgi:glucose/arabinose dehydrogenase
VPPLTFRATVKDDPDRELKGVFQAKVTDEGLELTQGRKHDILVPVGSRAKYLGGVTFRVEIDGRGVTFRVNQFGTYQNLIARDVAAFLRDEKGPLDPRKYRLEWYLLLPALLPAGIPIITLGGALWVMAAVVLVGLCVGVVQMRRWPAVLRVLTCVGISLVSYAVLFTLLFLPNLVGPRNFAGQAPFFRPPGVVNPWNPKPFNPAGNPPPGVANPGNPAQPQPLPPQFQPVPLVTIEVGGNLDRLDLSRDGNLLVLTSGGTMRRWDAVTGRYLGPTGAHPQPAHGVAISPDGRLIATGCADGKVRLWDAKTGGLRKEFPVQMGHVARVAFSPDGTLLATHCDAAFRIWELSTGKERAACAGSRGAAPVFGISNVSFSKDGKLIAAGDQANTAKVWDTATGELRHTLAGHRREALAVAFSPDGKLVATGSYDATVRLWDATTFAEVATLPANGMMISNVAFTPDGRLLAASGQNRLILWDVDGRKPLCELEGEGTPAGVAFSGDGSLLACGWQAQAVRIWDVSKLLGRVKGR